jgi:hypothetical protein
MDRAVAQVARIEALLRAARPTAVLGLRRDDATIDPLPSATRLAAPRKSLPRAFHAIDWAPKRTARLLFDGAAARLATKVDGTLFRAVAPSLAAAARLVALGP